MKSAELVEGSQAFTNFESAMRAILSVPREVVQKRLEEHRAEADANPKKRGPKKKTHS